MEGQWTVSLKGRPYHNVALNEAYECVINRRLKQITARPSHFRTVQLADFMAYLDVVLSGVEEWVSRNKANTTAEYNKKFVQQRAYRIANLPSMKSMFNDTNDKPLRNVFSDKHKKLDSVQIKDLLGILKIGTVRLVSYVRQHILKSEKPVKRKRQPIKTFTCKKSTQTQNKSLLKNVTTTLTNSFKHLQAAGAPSVQTCPYPLAIATINGEMRVATKSKFRSAIAHISSDMFFNEIL